MIGKAIKYMRRKVNLKQEVLAKKIDIARTTFAGYEQGYREPTFDTIEKIANECGYKIYFEDKKNNDKFELKDLDRKDI